MKLRSAFAMSLLGLAASLSTTGSSTAQDAVDPEDMVNAINSVYGSHKGYRAVHAKGFCGAGTLTASPDAAQYTKSTLFDGHAVPTMFRFSLAPGIPDASDTVQAPRSLVARMEDATSPFYAVNTFYFTNAQGERRPARWTAEPVAGEQGLTDEQIKSLSPDFMQDELRGRTGNGPVAWDLYLQLPEEGDPLLDASTPWPADRKKVKVAQLRLASVDEPGTKGPCNDVMFDPTSVPDGIEPSDDPVLLIRPAAYAVSFSRRMEP